MKRSTIITGLATALLVAGSVGVTAFGVSAAQAAPLASTVAAAPATTTAPTTFVPLTPTTATSFVERAAQFGAATANRRAPELPLEPLSAPQNTFTDGPYELRMATLPGGEATSVVVKGQYVEGYSAPGHFEPAAGEVLTWGGVGGGSDSQDHVLPAYSELLGQAGAGVDAVRVVTADGATHDAALANGLWGVVWHADPTVDGNAAATVTTVEFHMASGWQSANPHDIDLVAASQQ